MAYASASDPFSIIGMDPNSHVPIKKVNVSALYNNLTQEEFNDMFDNNLFPGEFMEFWNQNPQALEEGWVAIPYNRIPLINPSNLLPYDLSPGNEKAGYLNITSFNTGKISRIGDWRNVVLQHMDFGINKTSRTSGPFVTPYNLEYVEKYNKEFLEENNKKYVLDILFRGWEGNTSLDRLDLTGLDPDDTGVNSKGVDFKAITNPLEVYHWFENNEGVTLTQWGRSMAEDYGLDPNNLTTTDLNWLAEKALDQRRTAFSPEYKRLIRPFGLRETQAEHEENTMTYVGEPGTNTIFYAFEEDVEFDEDNRYTGDDERNFNFTYAYEDSYHINMRSGSFDFAPRQIKSIGIPLKGYKPHLHEHSYTLDDVEPSGLQLIKVATREITVDIPEGFSLFGSISDWFFGDRSVITIKPGDFVPQEIMILLSDEERESFNKTRAFFKFNEGNEMYLTPMDIDNQLRLNSPETLGIDIKSILLNDGYILDRNGYVTRQDGDDDEGGNTDDFDEYFDD